MHGQPSSTLVSAQIGEINMVYFKQVRIFRRNANSILLQYLNSNSTKPNTSWAEFSSWCSSCYWENVNSTPSFRLSLEFDNYNKNLAKLHCGLDKSPSVMVICQWSYQFSNKLQGVFLANKKKSLIWILLVYYQ